MKLSLWKNKKGYAQAVGGLVALLIVIIVGILDRKTTKKFVSHLGKFTGKYPEA